MRLVSKYYNENVDKSEHMNTSKDGSNQEKGDGLGREGRMGVTAYPRSTIEHQLVIRREIH